MQKKGKTLEEICNEVIRKVTPSDKENVLSFSNDLVKNLGEKLKSSGINAEVQVQGSVAKDTWISGETEIDMFIMIPKTCTREVFTKVLEVIKGFLGEKWVEAYAEHPYIKAEIKGYKIDFVPCFKIQRAEEVMSSVDRTPLHTAFLKSRLDRKRRAEVRLLKKFMLGIGMYGAEIKVGGFSGYLCELLILSYGSFIRVLKEIIDWKERIVIDYAGLYKGEKEKIKKTFEEPLVVVDPVDRRRNVAAAVRRDKLDEFVVAARAFLKGPNKNFFYPNNTKAYDANGVSHAMKYRQSTFVFIRFGKVKAVPDVLWGQLYKTSSSLRKLIEQEEFKVLRDSVWSDEKRFNVLVFELEQRFLTNIKKRFGPPIKKMAECEKFLQKHLDKPHTVSGPRIERGRWVIETDRRHIDVVEMLREKLVNGGRSVGVATFISESLAENFNIVTNEEIIEFYSSNIHFAKFLTEYLEGKPKWLNSPDRTV